MNQFDSKPFNSKPTSSTRDESKDSLFEEITKISRAKSNHSQRSPNPAITSSTQDESKDCLRKHIAKHQHQTSPKINQEQ